MQFWTSRTLEYFVTLLPGKKFFSGFAHQKIFNERIHILNMILFVFTQAFYFLMVFVIIPAVIFHLSKILGDKSDNDK